MAVQPDDEYCGRCRYYLDAEGECHRHSPTMYSFEARTLEERYEAHWPKVPDSAWCGDYGKPLGGPTAKPAPHEPSA